MLIPIAVLLLIFVLMSRSPIGVAIARRIAGNDHRGDGLEAAVEELREELEDVRDELRDTRERLEFAERLLASPRGRERHPLEGGALVIDRNG